MEITAYNMARLARLPREVRENQRFVFQWREGIIGSKIEDVNRKIVLTAKDGLCSCKIGSIVAWSGSYEADAWSGKYHAEYAKIRDYFEARGFGWIYDDGFEGRDIILYW